MAKDLVEEIKKQIVHTNSLFAVDDQFNDERFMRVRVAVMHSGINRNHSRFSLDTIKNAKSTFANIPILADVQKLIDDNGEEYLDYTTHSMHLEDDYYNEDNQKMIYDEKVVGIIPETNNFEIIHDDETDNDYVYVDALLYREYGNYVCDILEAKGGITDVSAEIACDECSFSAQDKCLDVGKMVMCGVTLLGEEVAPGMAKAHAQVFSMDEDSKQNQLIQIMQELTTALDNYTAAFAANTKESKEGGKNEEMNKFEELLEQYNKTIEDITFEFEGLSDEELEAKFAEVFEDELKKKKKEDDDAGTPAVDNESNDEPSLQSDDDEPALQSDDEPEQNDNNETQNSEDPEANEGGETGDPSLNSLTFNLGAKTYAVSLSDVMYALSELVNETYADECSYYSVEVYADDSYVIMQDWMSGRAYKQSFKCKKKNYSLVGDRVPVKAVYVTEDEEKELDKMRSNYSELSAKFEEVSDKLAKYEAEPEKIQILESEEYSSISDKEEYVELKKQENHFDLTIDELKNKADEIILSYAKKGALTFASVETPKVGVKTLTSTNNTPTKRSRYGGLGKKED